MNIHKEKNTRFAGSVSVTQDYRTIGSFGTFLRGVYCLIASFAMPILTSRHIAPQYNLWIPATSVCRYAPRLSRPDTIMARARLPSTLVREYHASRCLRYAYRLVYTALNGTPKSFRFPSSLYVAAEFYWLFFRRFRSFLPQYATRSKACAMRSGSQTCVLSLRC